MLSRVYDEESSKIRPTRKTEKALEHWSGSERGWRKCHGLGVKMGSVERAL